MTPNPVKFTRIVDHGMLIIHGMTTRMKKLQSRLWFSFHYAVLGWGVFLSLGPVLIGQPRTRLHSDVDEYRLSQVEKGLGGVDTLKNAITDLDKRFSILETEMKSVSSGAWWQPLTTIGIGLLTAEKAAATIRRKRQVDNDQAN